MGQDEGCRWGWSKDSGTCLCQGLFSGTWYCSVSGYWKIFVLSVHILSPFLNCDSSKCADPAVNTRYLVHEIYNEADMLYYIIHSLYFWNYRSEIPSWEVSQDYNFNIYNQVTSTFKIPHTAWWRSVYTAKSRHLVCLRAFKLDTNILSIEKELLCPLVFFKMLSLNFEKQERNLTGQNYYVFVSVENLSKEFSACLFCQSGPQKTNWKSPLYVHAQLWDLEGFYNRVVRFFVVCHNLKHRSVYTEAV